MFKKINEWRLRKIEENEAKLKELKDKPVKGINFSLHGVDYVVAGLDVISVMRGMRDSSTKTVAVKNLLDSKTHMIKPHYVKTYVDVTYYPTTGEYK